MFRQAAVCSGSGYVIKNLVSPVCQHDEDAVRRLLAVAPHVERASVNIAGRCQRRRSVGGGGLGDNDRPLPSVRPSVCPSVCLSHGRRASVRPSAAAEWCPSHGDGSIDNRKLANSPSDKAPQHRVYRRHRRLTIIYGYAYDHHVVGQHTIVCEEGSRCNLARSAKVAERAICFTDRNFYLFF